MPETPAKKPPKKVSLKLAKPAKDALDAAWPHLEAQIDQALAIYLQARPSAREPLRTHNPTLARLLSALERAGVSL